MRYIILCLLFAAIFHVAKFPFIKKEKTFSVFSLPQFLLIFLVWFQFSSASSSSSSSPIHLLQSIYYLHIYELYQLILHFLYIFHNKLQDLSQFFIEFYFFIFAFSYSMHFLVSCQNPPPIPFALFSYLLRLTAHPPRRKESKIKSWGSGESYKLGSWVILFFKS